MGDTIRSGSWKYHYNLKTKRYWIEAITPLTRASLTTRNTATPAVTAATCATPTESDGTAMLRLAGQAEPCRHQNLPGVEGRLDQRAAADDLGQSRRDRQGAQGDNRRHEQGKDGEEALVHVSGLGLAAPEHDHRPTASSPSAARPGQRRRTTGPR